MIKVTLKYIFRYMSCVCQHTDCFPKQNCAMNATANVAHDTLLEERSVYLDMCKPYAIIKFSLLSKALNRDFARGDSFNCFLTGFLPLKTVNNSYNDKYIFLSHLSKLTIQRM